MPLYSDPRTDEMRAEMAEHFAEYEADYRDADWCEIVHEDAECVVIADLKGYEFDEWADECRDDFSTSMHQLADQLTDRSWGSTYPVVFDKLE